MPRKSATLEAVADQAGVSIKTVSRVVNNEPFVSAKTMDKVQAAIKELQFEPNMAARQLRGQRSYSLALIYEPPSSEFLTGILEGVLRVCRNAAYKVLLEPLSAEESRVHIAIMIERRMADGFILLPPLSDDVMLIRSILDAKLDAVLIASTLDIVALNLPVSKFGIDDYSAGLEMGRYFIDRGHKRIGYISLRLQHNMANRRGDGLKAAMIEAGIPAENFLLAEGRSSFESGYEAAEILLSKEERPTAIFAGNDYMAAGVIARAKEMNIEVPNDLSVAGFDGADLSKMFVPPFMTVEQPLNAYGEQAAKRLLATIQNPDSLKGETQLAYKLIPRRSVKILDL